MNNLNQKFTNDNNNNNYQQQQKTTKIHHSFRNCQSSLSLLMLFTTNPSLSLCSTGFNSKFKWPLFYHKSTMFSIKIFIIHFLMIITTLLSTFNNNIVYANEFNEIWQPQAAQVFEIEYPSIVADDQSSLINSSSSSSNIKPNTETIDNSILKTKSTLLNVVNDLQPIKYEPELNYQNDVDDDQNFIVVNNNDGGNTLINENNLNDNDNDNDGNNVIDNNEFDDNDYYNDNDDDDDDDDDDDKMLNSTSRLKREVFRGQNYHYQRGYELSRLRYENRLRTDPNAAKPKAFFLREYHQGRDVPREILRLTQGGLISEHPLTTTTTKQSNSGGHDSDMKTMSDYQQQLFATKAALKAAIQSGDKDFSILDYLNKMKAKIDSDRRQQNSGGGGGASGGGRPSGNNVLIPTTGGAGTGGGMSGGNHPGTINPDHIIEQIKDIDQKHGGIDGGNLGVRFDEQLKEDLNKILPYDPSKQFGERIRPFRPSYIGSTPGSDQDQGSGGSNAGQSGGGGGVSSSPGGGAGGGSGSPADDYLNKISRLYPHLFPGHTGQGIPGARPSGGGGSGSSGYGPGSSDDGSGRPSGDSDGGNTGSGNRPGGGGSGGGSGPGSSAGSGAPYADGGSGGGSYSPSGGGSGSPSGQYGGGGSGSASGLGIRPAPLPPSYISPIGNRTGTYPPVPTLGTPASAYPARFPGRLLSALTLYPGVRNSTFPGFPGYIRIDYPGYNTVPYTGFRCELQPYKIGYYADVAASCQVFHICQRDGRMDSFLCPNGTLFHQKVMTCDWWYLVNCPASPSYYYLNGRIGVLPPLPATVGRFD